MKMSPRERVLAVLAGERPDQAVADLGGRVASANTTAYLRLKAHLGFGLQLEDEKVTALNTIGHPDERILQHFDVPIRRIYLRPPCTYQLHVAPDGSFQDEWGVGYQPMGHYNERTGHPLAEASLEDVETFPWPDPTDPGRLQGLQAELTRLRAGGDVAIAAGHVSAGIFQDCWNLRGMQRFFEDMALKSEFAQALLAKVTAVHIGLWQAFLGQVGAQVDLVETADDLGGQNGLLISPDMYRRYVKPFQADLNAAIRAQSQAKILFHSCGAVMPLIDDFLEIGVDILNPIQPLPGHMDPEALGDRYGSRLIFHGGLDVQRLLPYGSPQEIRSHVWRYYQALGSARYIMAPANSIQPDTPPENIAAAYAAARAWKQSP